MYAIFFHKKIIDKKSLSEYTMPRLKTSIEQKISKAFGGRKHN